RNPLSPYLMGFVATEIVWRMYLLNCKRYPSWLPKWDVIIHLFLLGALLILYLMVWGCRYGYFN
ncbi:MAG: hypothetical protein LBM70_08950, partial [Victivallales bacterium]|nr:hypothetical protein [Victivallales bacterium]